MNSKFLTRKISSGIKRSRIAWIMILASLFLSGCVKYDVGVNFDRPNHGEIVQHIKLGERLTSFSGDSATQWLNSIEQRTKRLEGKVKRLSSEEITVTIPFNNGADLETKFNQFFNPVEPQNSTKTSEELPKIDSKLEVAQNNLLLLSRQVLTYDLDLRSLSLIANNGNVLVSPGAVFDLEFSLNTPWGGRSIEKSANSIPPQTYGQQMLWKLQPGQLNHIEVVFWMPDFLGIGTVFICLFVALGIFLRYSFMPDPQTFLAPTPQNQ
ncbi:DUF3153 domain-containing protein [Synechocystis sp. PCC 7509]|uniref:DUF3153 domain-containing protein n=1 Tax=Synechocystis sp. PCC 7509 TaxID=927677 RepID=UPI0002ACACB3|nr:DUF3153 domain-containing protein [Synechocystis sp. PCC 7509]